MSGRNGRTVPRSVAHNSTVLFHDKDAEVKKGNSKVSRGSVVP